MEIELPNLFHLPAIPSVEMDGINIKGAKVFLEGVDVTKKYKVTEHYGYVQVTLIKTDINEIK